MNNKSKLVTAIETGHALSDAIRPYVGENKLLDRLVNAALFPTGIREGLIDIIESQHNDDRCIKLGGKIVHYLVEDNPKPNIKYSIKQIVLPPHILTKLEPFFKENKIPFKDDILNAVYGEKIDYAFRNQRWNDII